MERMYFCRKNLEKKRDYRKRTIGHKVNQEDSPKISVIVSLLERGSYVSKKDCRC